MNKNDLDKCMEDNPFAILGELIYTGIYNEIISGKLMPGEKLLEVKISRSLGVSRTPVKIAISRLIEEDLLYKQDGKVPVVKRISYEKCLWLYEARKTIESKAAYIAAKRINNEEIVQLKQIMLKLQECDEQLDNYLFAEYDKKFHDVIIQACRNKYIIGMYQTLECDLQRYRHHFSQLVLERNRMENGQEFHRAIYRALKNRMALVAQNEVEADIDRMYGTIHTFREKSDY